MTLSEYLTGLSAAEKRLFAEACGTSPKYLYQIGAGIRAANMVLAIAIERESGGKVQAESLVPAADWDYLRSKFTDRRQLAIEAAGG